MIDAEFSSRLSTSNNDKYPIMVRPGSNSSRSSLHHPGPASGNNDAAVARSHSSIKKSTSASAINMDRSYPPPLTLSADPLAPLKLCTTQQNVHNGNGQ